MAKFKILLNIFTLAFLLYGCGEEAFNTTTTSDKEVAVTNSALTLKQCADKTFDPPEVDFLYLVDNSGSASTSQFTSLKSEITKTFDHVSTDFNFHILVAPLLPVSGETLTGFPVLLNYPDSVPSLATINRAQNVSDINVFSAPAGGNAEKGFNRVQTLIDANRSNGVFRNDSHIIVVLVSNEYDTDLYTYIAGNPIYQQSKYNTYLNSFKKYTKKYVFNGGSVVNPLNAESFRLITVTPHSNCGSFLYRPGYKQMAIDLYNYNDVNSSSYPAKDAHDICSGNFTSIFSSINSTIKKVLIKHRYNYSKISSATEAQIQADDIKVIKVKEDGSQVVLPVSGSNGFQYVGYKVNQNTRFEPTVGEPKTGLMIKLNGNARITYPECISATTRTPTEWFGYYAMPKNPNLTTLKVYVRGKEYPQSTTNGWSFIGYSEILNVKVPGPSGAAITPALNKSGYFIKLHGEAIYTNGESIEVVYKATAL